MAGRRWFQPNDATPCSHRSSDPVIPRFLDWIWHIKGSLVLPPGQSSDEAFDRLDPLFRETGTSHERSSDTLTFRKKDPAAQDKMSIFNDGVLQIQRGAAGFVLHYYLTSRALLFCFLMPLLFLGFAQMTIAMGKLQEPKSEAVKKPEKKTELPQSPIDKALGAPAPEKPKKDKPDDDKPSPTAAYVFAAIFAVLWLVGRTLEDWLIKAQFRKRLLG